MQTAVMFVTLPRLLDSSGKAVPAAQACLSKYLDALNEKEALQQIPENWRLHDTLWQIPLDSGLLVLSTLVLLCKECSASCHIILFEEPPKWIGSVADSKKEK